MKKHRASEMLLLVLLVASLACLIITQFVKWSKLTPDVPMVGLTEWDIGLWRSNLHYTRDFPTNATSGTGYCPTEADACNFKAVLGEKFENVVADNCKIQCDTVLQRYSSQFDFLHRDLCKEIDNVANKQCKNLNAPGGLLIAAAGMVALTICLLLLIFVTGWTPLWIILGTFFLFAAVVLMIVGLVLGAVWTVSPATDIDSTVFQWKLTHGFNLALAATVLAILALIVFCLGSLSAYRSDPRPKLPDPSPSYSQYGTPSAGVISPTVGPGMPLVQEIPQPPPLMMPPPMGGPPQIIDFGRSSPIMAPIQPSVGPVFVPYS